MPYITRSVLRRASAVAAGALLTFCAGHAFAGAQASADKEVAKQQVAADEPFKLQFNLEVGGESEFVFRGVDILPEVDINVRKGLTEAINALPAFRQFLAENGLSSKQFVKSLTGLPTTPVEVSRENGLYIVDGNVSGTFRGTTATLGAFYGTQSGGRPDHNFFGNDPIFDAYHEFDAYLNFSRAFGPVRVSLGGTFYHVVNNSDSDTAELNFGVRYTPPQFPYVTASFSYDYTSAFAISDSPANTGGYLDGHYLELRVGGNIPVPATRKSVRFQPYVLVSAGSGILARTLNLASLPTYQNTTRYGQSLQPFVNQVFHDVVGGGLSPNSARGAVDPQTLDRSFDLSNFQAGFRVPFYLTRHITIQGDFNYSRPLGNLQSDPYNQKDQVWGGGSVSVTF